MPTTISPTSSFSRSPGGETVSATRLPMTGARSGRLKTPRTSRVQHATTRTREQLPTAIDVPRKSKAGPGIRGRSRSRNPGAKTQKPRPRNPGLQGHPGIQDYFLYLGVGERGAQLGDLCLCACGAGRAKAEKRPNRLLEHVDTAIGPSERGKRKP